MDTLIDQRDWDQALLSNTKTQSQSQNSNLVETKREFLWACYKREECYWPLLGIAFRMFPLPHLGPLPLTKRETVLFHWTQILNCCLNTSINFNDEKPIMYSWTTWKRRYLTLFPCVWLGLEGWVSHAHPPASGEGEGIPIKVWQCWSRSCHSGYGECKKNRNCCFISRRSPVFVHRMINTVVSHYYDVW